MTLHGSCLCGAVAYAVGPQQGRAVACHCDECRRQSGHHFAAVPVAKDSVVFDTDAGLAWYRASPIGARGFCARCGSTLFWRGDEGASVHVLMGSLDAPAGLRLDAHVWVSEQGDYYNIGGDLPQFQEG